MNVAKFLKEGKTSPWYHYLSRPEFVEAEADKRAVHWAKSVDAPLYIVHMADKEGLEAAIAAKHAGAPIYVETCPQYLEFTCDVYKREDGRNFVCSPPIKGEESRQALWKAVADGSIDTVATDHCPFMSYEKDWGKDDFTKIPNGCAGVENLYPYMLSAANEGKISFSARRAAVRRQPGEASSAATQKGLAHRGQGRRHRGVRSRQNRDRFRGQHAFRLRPHHLGRQRSCTATRCRPTCAESWSTTTANLWAKPGYGKFIKRTPAGK